MNEESDPDPDQDEGGASREAEVRFRTDPDGLRQMLASPRFAPPATVRSETLRTIYFDTGSGDLRKGDIALSVRKRGRGGTILGMKAGRAATTGLFPRAEIAVRSHSLQPDLALFGADTAAGLARLVGQRPLEAQFETRIRRRRVLLQQGRSQIELVFDEGGIVAGDRTVALADVELNLKAGEEGDLYDLAMQLAEEFPLRLDFVSKAERGFGLVSGEGPQAAKAASLEYEADTTLDDAVVAIVSNALEQFAGNWAALRATEQPEAVHQARVALRRLRAALGIFGHALPCAQFDALRNEARRIASIFGPTRECDVFLKSLAEGPFAHADRPAGWEMLLASVEQRRAGASRDVRALVEDIDTTRFVLDVRKLLAHRAWRNGLDSAELALLSGPARAFAREALGRLHARALKRGKRLAELPDAARHELRIALKNLRYGAEFFGTLFGGRRKVRRYVATVSALQDLLGAHNDVVGARQLLDALPAGLEKTSGFVLGWLARQSSIADAELGEAWKAFKKADRFWR